jgi:hypothetical protein
VRIGQSAELHLSLENDFSHPPLDVDSGYKGSLEYTWLRHCIHRWLASGNGRTSLDPWSQYLLVVIVAIRWRWYC